MTAKSAAFAFRPFAIAMPIALTRAQVVEFVRRHAIPPTRARIEMAFMLLITTVTGFAASLALLAAGLESMAVRYPLAVALAYGVFLLQLGLWLRYRLAPERGRARRAEGDPSRGSDFGGFGSGGGGGDWEPFRGRGGRFGGSGATGGWRHADGAAGEAHVASLAEAGMRGSARARGGGGSGGSGGGGDDDSGKLLALVALALLALVVCLVFALAVYAAPALLAEILADGLIAGGLYRGARGLEATHWVRSALRRTLLPVLAVMVVACIVGIVVQNAVPGARWIGDVFVTGSDRPARTR